MPDEKISLLFCLLTMAFIDLRKRRIPNIGILIVCGMRIAFWIFEEAEETGQIPKIIFTDLKRAFLVLALLLILEKLGRGTFGMGDVKLLGSLALFLEIQFMYEMSLCALGLSALTSIFWLLSGKKERKDGFPFVPFLFAGYVAAYWWEGI